MAIRIILNGKTNYVCNALDKVLIDENLPNIQERINQLVSALKSNGIEVLGNSSVCALDEEIVEVNNEKVLYEEFLHQNISFPCTDITEAIRLIIPIQASIRQRLSRTNFRRQPISCTRWIVLMFTTMLPHGLPTAGSLVWEQKLPSARRNCISVVLSEPNSW